MAAHTLETIHPKNKTEWRDWLEKFHDIKNSVWLIYHKKKANKSRLTWSEAVDVALCFGWIDSIAKPIDDDTYMQFFSRRKPGSGWSRINKEKIERLTEAGLMSEAGLKTIAVARQNGSWTLLDDIENLTVPADLKEELHKYPLALSYFSGLSRSDQRNILQWVVLAKKAETRKKRITEIIEQAILQLKPKPFQGK